MDFNRESVKSTMSPRGMSVKRGEVPPARDESPLKSTINTTDRKNITLVESILYNKAS